MKKILSIISIILINVSCNTLDNEPIKYIDRNSGETLIEKVPAEKFMKFLYTNPFGKANLDVLIKRKTLTSIYGKIMDSPMSKKKIKKFVEDYDIDMTESEKTVDEFKTFNEFFCRKLKKSARPINQDKNSIISPADGKILVFSKISDIDGLYIKGIKFELKKFLNDDKLENEYRNGSIAIIRLAPSDYHRVHFPYDGKISKSKLINGVYYSVSPIAHKSVPNIFWENKREISKLSTDKIGDILIIEVGATMVGGIHQSYISDSYVKKGNEKSYFYFGGSTVILIFKENSITFDTDLLENTKKKLETKIFMGEKIAKIKNK